MTILFLCRSGLHYRIILNIFVLCLITIIEMLFHRQFWRQSCSLYNLYCISFSLFWDERWMRQIERGKAKFTSPKNDLSSLTLVGASHSWAQHFFNLLRYPVSNSLCYLKILRTYTYQERDSKKWPKIPRNQRK